MKHPIGRTTDPTLPLPTAELRALVERELAAQTERVFITTFADQPIVIKRAALLPRGWLLSGIAGWFSMLISGRLPSLSALRLAGSKSQVEYEAHRLIGLKTAGIKVPEVIAVTEGWLAISYVGDPIDRRVPKLTHAEQAELFDQLARELAVFHQQGQWHGASQIRNITMKDGKFYRIDFEENLSAMPLYALQTYDLLLFLGACVRRYGRTPKVDVALADSLLQAYLAVNPHPRIQTYLRRCHYLMAPLAFLLRPFVTLLGRDAKRWVLLSQALSRRLKTARRTRTFLLLAALCVTFLAVYD